MNIGSEVRVIGSKKKSSGPLVSVGSKKSRARVVAFWMQDSPPNVRAPALHPGVSSSVAIDDPVVKTQIPAAIALPPSLGHPPDCVKDRAPPSCAQSAIAVPRIALQHPAARRNAPDVRRIDVRLDGRCADTTVVRAVPECLLPARTGSQSPSRTRPAPGIDGHRCLVRGKSFRVRDDRCKAPAARVRTSRRDAAVAGIDAGESPYSISTGVAMAVIGPPSSPTASNPSIIDFISHPFVFRSRLVRRV